MASQPQFRPQHPRGGISNTSYFLGIPEQPRQITRGGESLPGFLTEAQHVQVAVEFRLEGQSRRTWLEVSRFVSPYGQRSAYMKTNPETNAQFHDYLSRLDRLMIDISVIRDNSGSPVCRSRTMTSPISRFPQSVMVAYSSILSTIDRIRGTNHVNPAEPPRPCPYFVYDLAIFVAQFDQLVTDEWVEGMKSRIHARLADPTTSDENRTFATHSLMAIDNVIEMIDALYPLVFEMKAWWDTLPPHIPEPLFAGAIPHRVVRGQPAPAVPAVEAQA